MVRLTDHPGMTIDVYRGCKQQHNINRDGPFMILLGAKVHV